MAGSLIRTYFEVTLDPDELFGEGATCLECAAENEKQKLIEAAVELQRSAVAL